MSYSLFVAPSAAAAAAAVWRSLSPRPGGETWPGSAEPGPSGCSTEPDPGCEGREEGRRGRDLSCRPGRGWPGGSLWPTGDRRAAGPAGGTDPPGYQTGQANVQLAGVTTDLRWPGDFLGSGERNIHRVEEDGIHRHLLVGAGEIQGQADTARDPAVLELVLVLQQSRAVIIRPGPLAVFLTFRLNLQSI